MKNKFLLILPIFLILFDLKAQKKISKLAYPLLKSTSVPSSPTIKLKGNASYNYQPKLVIGNSNKNNLSKISGGKIIITNTKGFPIFIQRKTSNARLASNGNVKEACFDFLNSVKTDLKIPFPNQIFEISKMETETSGEKHINLIQKYKGVKVYNAEAKVHLTATNEGEIFNGNYYSINRNLDTAAKISPSEALAIVKNNLSKANGFHEIDEAQKHLLLYKSPLSEKVIYILNGLIETPVLAYHIGIQSSLIHAWDFIVDANTGKILKKLAKDCHADGARTTTATDLNGMTRTINTYQIGSEYYLYDATKSMFKIESNKLIGLIQTYDANFTYGKNVKLSIIKNGNNVWNNPKAVSAHYNAGIAFDYFKNTHARNSIDGKGGDIFSIININDEDGGALDNAYWNGAAMFYGNGKDAFTAFAGSLDVAGHEMTHGVVQNTANLEYEGESGAINESMADIFGCMMDSTDWLIGEDVVKTNVFTSGALRSLSDPHNGGTSLNDNGYQPKHMNQKYTGSEDNGGVHINSGIPNYAFYKLATQIGRYRASKIFYRALSVYLTKSSQFIDLRIATIQSAKDLFGENSNEAVQVANAFAEVGIGEGNSNTGTDVEIETNTGAEYLMTFDTNSENSNGLYRTNADGSNEVPLTNKGVDSRISITDDGSLGVFAGTDDKLYYINTKPTGDLNLNVLQNEAIWDNVAISKDGNRLAAITTSVDTAIYIYDFVSEKWKKFQLYSPTFTEGVKAPGPLYADAIEWSYDGESLIYDCFNLIPKDNGDSLKYWDINVLKAWDNAKKDFGDGSIQKLFNNLERGESIGNPVFSKTSPSIIAFDYNNENTNTYGVLGLNLEKNDLKYIADNNSYGYPCFNKDDSRLAFRTFSGEVENVVYVTLNSDKISSNGTTTLLVPNARWPVFYSIGTRVYTSTEGTIENKIYCYPNPNNGLLNLANLVPNKVYRISIKNSLGTEIKSVELSQGKSSVELSEISAGIYTISITNDGVVQNEKLVIE